MGEVKKGERMGPVDVASDGALPAFTDVPFDVKTRVVDLNGAALVVLEVSTSSLGCDEAREYLDELSRSIRQELQDDLRKATGRDVPVWLVAKGSNDVRTLDAAEIRTLLGGLTPSEQVETVQDLLEGMSLDDRALALRKELQVVLRCNHGQMTFCNRCSADPNPEA